MDVLLSEEEEMLKNLAREFLDAECPPSVARAMEQDDLGYPPELWKKMADLGWFGLALPEKYGGQGASLTYLAIILEEVGRAIVPVPFHSTAVSALTVARNGTEEQCEQILPAVSRGDLILAWAFFEADPRLISEAVETSAVANGDDFVINGKKMFVDNFSVAEKCVVVCRTAPASASSQGLSVFLVDTDSPGISQISLVTMAKDKQSEVQFNNVRVPKGNLIGRVNEGWPIAEHMLDQATVLLCAQIVGAARKNAEISFEYAKNRTAFGRPIGAFQSVGHMCADMLIWVDGGQMLTYEALWKMDHGLSARAEVSQAKAFCNDKCQAIIRYSQMIHGGLGFMMEFNLHLWYRRVAAWTMRLGTSLDHRARLAKVLFDQPGRVRLGNPQER
jgi:alkylation response protein AidB-like acyl-CoA dehydrogenase